MIINEIFYSLQGEGYYSGTPAVFVRFSGCNLQCPFCDTQHDAGTAMAEEAIGTHPLPGNVDWITLSPKSAYVDGAEVVLSRADEVKVVYDGEHDPSDQLSTFNFQLLTLRFLQPCDTGDARRNARLTAAAVEYVKQHPQWRLSLQIHKILNIQ